MNPCGVYLACLLCACTLIAQDPPPRVPSEQPRILDVTVNPNPKYIGWVYDTSIAGWKNRPITIIALNDGKLIGQVGAVLNDSTYDFFVHECTEVTDRTDTLPLEKGTLTIKDTISNKKYVCRY